MRIKRAVNAVKKRRKIFKLAKGYRGAKSKLYRISREAVMKSQMTLSSAERTRKALSVRFGSPVSTRRQG